MSRTLACIHVSEVQLVTLIISQTTSIDLTLCFSQRSQTRQLHWNFPQVKKNVGCCSCEGKKITFFLDSEWDILDAFRFLTFFQHSRRIMYVKMRFCNSFIIHFLIFIIIKILYASVSVYLMV